MEQVTSWIADHVGFGEELIGRVLSSLLVLVLLWLLRLLVMRLVFRKSSSPLTLYRARKAVSYGSWVLGTLVLGQIWFSGFESLTTFLGLLSAGVAIALKDLIVNLAGWVFIVWRKPFETGDRIQVAQDRGDVIDVRPFQFTLLEVGNWVDADQSTGRVIHIPNGSIFVNPVYNYSHGFPYIWNELPVLVTFESNWKRAKLVLTEVARAHAEHIDAKARQQLKEAAKKFMIVYSTLTPTVYTSVKDSGVELTIRYLCLPRERRGTAEAIWEDILTRFAAEPEIDLAYPTQRFYSNASEGKLGLRPPP